MVDLGTLQPVGSIPNPAKLIPIIPPSKGYGHDLYKELGTDRVFYMQDLMILIKISQQILNLHKFLLVKNPLRANSTNVFDDNQFSSTNAIKLLDDGTISGENSPTVGKKITQSVSQMVNLLLLKDMLHLMIKTQKFLSFSKIDLKTIIQQNLINKIMLV